MSDSLQQVTSYARQPPYIHVDGSPISDVAISRVQRSEFSLSSLESDINFPDFEKPHYCAFQGTSLFYALLPSMPYMPKYRITK